jgi:hypothetical protein
MMKKPPNVRSQNPELGNFDDEFADLQEILYRSAQSERSGPQDLDDLSRREDDRRYPAPGTPRGGDARNVAAGRHSDQPFDDRDHDEALFPDDEADDSVPAFLSDETDEQDYPENWLLKRKSSLSLRILVGVVVAAGAAILFALVTSDTTRAVIANAKTSIGGTQIDQPAKSATDPGQLTLGDMQLKDPTRLSAPPPAPQVRPGPGNGGLATAALPSSREDLTNAYSPPAPDLRTRPPPPDEPPIGAAPVRRMDRDELATLMRRAKGLLAAGDIPSARLLLERAANAQDANAAFMLGQTYDPQMLGTQDIRKIKSDPAIARAWYQQAAQLGSADAQRRLGQLRN